MSKKSAPASPKKRDRSKDKKRDRSKPTASKKSGGWEHKGGGLHPEGGPVIQKKLPVPLNFEELQAKNHEHGVLDDQIEASEKKIKDFAKEERTKIKAERLKRRAISRDLGLDPPSETRDVDCQEIPDYNRGKVHTIRLDTGEVVEGSMRDMSFAERQTKMKGIADAPAAAKPATSTSVKAIAEAPAQVGDCECIAFEASDEEGMTCTCEHELSEHGKIPKFPGSTACRHKDEAEDVDTDDESAAG